MKLIFLDTETGSVDPGKAALLQLGGIIISGETRKEFLIHSQPFKDDEVTDEALAVSQISRESIASFPTPQEAHREFCSILGGFIDKFNRKDKLIILGYNVATFDIPILRRWFLNCNDVYFGSWFWHPPIDLMSLSAYALRNERGNLQNFKLASVAKYFGIEFDENILHNALQDSKICVKLFEKINQRLQGEAPAEVKEDHQDGSQHQSG